MNKRAFRFLALLSALVLGLSCSGPAQNRIVSLAEVKPLMFLPQEIKLLEPAQTWTYRGRGSTTLIVGRVDRSLRLDTEVYGDPVRDRFVDTAAAKIAENLAAVPASALGRPTYRYFFTLRGYSCEFHIFDDGLFVALVYN
jgi:hypothetical protein